MPSGETVEEARSALIAKVGENVQVRRLVRAQSSNNVAAYVHGGRIGVLVEVKGGNADLARGLAMHVAAMNPPYVKASDVPADFVAKEKEIELAKMTDKDKAKPADILEKIIGGKIAKIVNEVTLYGQPYVLDTNQNVEAVLKSAGAGVVGFQRLAVGEGIEKQGDDFAAEVMKQAGSGVSRPLVRLQPKKAAISAAFLLPSEPGSLLGLERHFLVRLHHHPALAGELPAGCSPRAAPNSVPQGNVGRRSPASGRHDQATVRIGIGEYRAASRCTGKVSGA